MENPGRKSAISYNFGKVKPRFDPIINNDDVLVPDVLVLDPQLAIKKVKGNVRFTEGNRFDDNLQKDDDRPHNTEMKIDLDKAHASTKPKATSVGFTKATNVAKKVESKHII